MSGFMEPGTNTLNSEATKLYTNFVGALIPCAYFAGATIVF
jgi:hypothetical protein